jgi:hypothetical protein
VDEIAHDEQLECSNMGLCQRQTGQCSCRPGFEVLMRTALVTKLILLANFGYFSDFSL